jgi:hypothetical protein
MLAIYRLCSCDWNCFVGSNFTLCPEKDHCGVSHVILRLPLPWSLIIVTNFEAFFSVFAGSIEH